MMFWIFPKFDEMHKFRFQNLSDPKQDKHKENYTPAYYINAENQR